MKCSYIVTIKTLSKRRGLAGPLLEENTVQIYKDSADDVKDLLHLRFKDYRRAKLIEDKVLVGYSYKFYEPLTGFIFNYEVRIQEISKKTVVLRPWSGKKEIERFGKHA